MARLSVIIITLNEERRLPELLASIRDVADEVIVVDSGSTDRTIEIARAAGARVFENTWPGFGKQRQFATSLAQSDWLLFLDADERLSPELAAAIRAEFSKPESELCAGYRIHFRHKAFGKPVRFGAVWKDECVRLFDRRRGGYNDALVHEKVVVRGPIGELAGRCDHEGYADSLEARHKLAGHAEASARERFRRGTRPHPSWLVSWSAGFLERYLLRLGFLDGRTGLRLALHFAEHDADKARWIARFQREIGGAHGRGPIVNVFRTWMRLAAVTVAQWIWPKPGCAMPALAEIRKVLVVRTDERIGNQLLIVPLLRALKLGLPAAEIDVLAAARQSAVLSIPQVSHVIPFEKRLAFRAPWRMLALLGQLRSARYDVAIEAGHWSGFSFTASIITRLTGARVIVGHLRGESGRFLSHAVTHNPDTKREVSAKLELLGPFGLTPCGFELDTGLGKNTRPAEELLLRIGLGASRDLAVLCPGARMADRRWSPSSYAAVAQGLCERGLHVLVTWGPGEESMARAIASASGAYLSPRTDLELLAALLRLARLCVSNNSGPMHLAVAVRIPTVGVFLMDDAERWGHELPFFAAAEPSGESDAATVLAACDRLLAASREQSQQADSSGQTRAAGRSVRS